MMTLSFRDIRYVKQSHRYQVLAPGRQGAIEDPRPNRTTGDALVLGHLVLRQTGKQSLRVSNSNAHVCRSRDSYEERPAESKGAASFTALLYPKHFQPPTSLDCKVLNQGIRGDRRP